MADELINIGATGNHGRLADQGDGSFAPVQASAPVRGAWTNRSGTITTGGTAQPLAAANAARKALFIQNNGTGPLWVDFGATAVQSQPSTQLLPGDVLKSTGPFIDTESISIIGATTGQTFTAKEA